jgi:hypothetical protein
VFVARNRMHDSAYYLGFTDVDYDMQLDNLGRHGDPEADLPELGGRLPG